MPWLVRDGEVLAALEVAEDRRARRKGLLGRDGLEGALLLTPTRAVHTVGMRFPIDVAFCAEAPAVDAAVGAHGTNGKNGKNGKNGTDATDGTDGTDGTPRVFTVLKTTTMPRHRVGLPCFKAAAVVEAEAGAFARWGLRPGDTLEVR